MSAKKITDGMIAIAVIAAMILAPALALGGSGSDDGFDDGSNDILFAGYPAEQKPLRLHVLAASDDDYDQSVKLTVRDRVIEYLEPVLSACSSREEAMAAVEERLPMIERLCNTCLSHCCVSYSATAHLETADFPSIAYGGVLLAAGDYDALRIVLGSGSGHNWWCVLFPPLCFVDLAAESDGEEVLTALAKVDTYDSTGEDTGLEIKWKLAELLHRQKE